MYSYAKLKPTITNDAGTVDLIALLDRARRLFGVAGCATFEKLTEPISGDSWRTMALVDRLVEMRKLRRLAIGDQDVRSHLDVYFPGSDWVN